MPTYEYRCKSCDEGLEAQQSFTDPPLTDCPACGGVLRKVFGNIAVTFKGSGFYKTDSRPTSSTSTSSTSSSDKSESKSEGKSESKSEGSSESSETKTAAKSEPKKTESSTSTAPAAAS